MICEEPRLFGYQTGGGWCEGFSWWSLTHALPSAFRGDASGFQGIKNQMNDSPDKLRVMAVFNLYPIYRRALFDLLLDDTDIETTICIGKEPNIPSLAVVEGDVLRWYVEKKRLLVTRNVWIGKSFLWQKKVAWPNFYKGSDVVIHTGSIYQISTWFALVWCRLAGKRSLLWTHGLQRKELGAKGFIRRLFYRLSNGLLLYGHRARELLIDCGFDPDRLYVMYNSLDYQAQKRLRNYVTKEDIAEYRSRFFDDPSLPLIIYVGRLTSEKHPLMLVELTDYMAKTGEPVNLIVIGEGPELPAMQDLIRQKHIEGCICLYGACYEEKELAKLVKGADVAVVPAYVGLSAMHFMAYGIPVITSDDLKNQKPEVEAIVPGETGGFYRHGDIYSLAEQVSLWIKAVDSKTKERCIRKIEESYNPEIQVSVIKYACMGLPASKRPV